MKTLLPNTLAVITLLLIPLLTFGQAPNLGASSSFALFTAAGAFTNDGATVVTGDIGTNVGLFSGFPPGIVIGGIHVADALTAQAAADVATAYGELSAVTCDSVIGTTLGSGQTLTPNVYCLGGASSLNGELILDAQGDPGAIFIFKIDGALSTTTLSRVTLINGASVCNVYWQINGAVELGPGSSFAGTILAAGAISLLEGASFIGRGLSTQGAISLHNNMVTGLSPVASVITSSGPTTFCAGGSVVLSGNVGGTWSTGATTPTITVTTSGDYFVTNTAPCGSIQSNHIMVVVNPLPSCTISGSDVICGGQATELCAPVGAASYLWNTGASTRCINVTTAGTYSITVTSASGCVSICSKILVDSPLPICAITGIAAICVGQTTQLCASGGTSYLWSTGATTSCIDVTAAGTYTVTVTSANGCSSTCSQIVTVNPLPICTITGSAAVCAGLSTQLCASGGTSYLWSTGASTSCIDVSVAGTYTVTVTNANGCTSTCSQVVTVNPAPICAITGSAAICVGLSTQLCASGGTSYLWSTGATTSCIDVSAAGTYTVTVTNANGCSSTCSQIVTVNPLPICAITGNAAICADESTQLCASGGTSYLWSTGASTSCIDVTAAGTYTVTVTNANGCSSTCSQVVTVNPAPSCAITGIAAICVGQTTQLCASGGTSYLWSTGAVTSCIDVTAAGTYSVTVTNANGCSSTCSQIITVNPLPICAITGSAAICAGLSTQLCASGGSSYLWSTGATTSCIDVTAAGTYSVTVTNASGCSSTCSQVVTVNAAPVCAITGITAICAGQSTQLCASGGTSYLWSTGASTSCIDVTAAGTYTVTVTNASGCSSTCSQVVTVNPLPICLITGNDAICQAGQSSELCASGGTSYLWSTGASTSCITINAAGTYSVTVTNASGCISICSKTITINPQPICTIAGNDAICPGESTQLCATGGTSYLWSTGASTSCISINAAGTYSVTVTNADACISTCSKIITINPLPVCLITGNDAVCAGQSIQLCASGGSSYLWSTGASTSCIDVTAAGTYSVTVTDANGCSSTCSKIITINPLPVCLITGNDAVCAGQSIQLCASGGSSYLWSTGASTSCIDVTAAGTYSVTVTDANGCSSTCSQIITVNPLPICLITGNDAICAGQSIQLCASGGSSYLWSTGASTSCINVNAAGTYSVTVTDVNGCISTCSKIISANPLPICTITGNDAICAGQSIQLCASGGSSYLWSTGASTSCINVNAAGTYSVTVTSEGGCISTCSKIITANPLPICLITGNATICIGQSIQLCASGGFSYLWSTGASTSCIDVNAAGTYSVTVTDVNGCSSTCSQIITVNPLPICLITGNDAICIGQSIQLCASGGSSYLWSTGASTSCINVTAAGTYSVTVTDVNGCSSTCSKIISANPLPMCTITGNDAICAGQSIQLCASGGFSYLWSTGASTSCINVSAAGTYSVTVTSISGCVSTCSKIIVASPLPICAITVNAIGCEGQSTQLCASGGTSYLWSTGASTSCINVNATGTYTVTVTNASGCFSICSETITIAPVPVCLITGNDAICVGQSTQLCASGGTSYMWSTGASTSCINVNAAGNYSVTITDAGGCIQTCSKLVTVSQVASCLITGPNGICVGQSAQLCVPAGATSYLWSTGATTNCITVNEVGTYSVTVSNAGECTSICSKEIRRSQSSTCLITGEDLICLGQSTQLCVPTGAVRYLWSTGATTNCITVNAVGTYSVTVTEAEGCTSVCSKTIKLSQETNCLITGNNTVCVGQSIELCAAEGAVSYLWSTGATTNCISVNAAGTYRVTVTYPGGCISTCSRTITLSPAVSCVITGNSFICEGRIAQLCAPALADAYLWSNGAITRCIQVSLPGTYSVTVTYVGGCVSTCSKTITLNEETTCEITGNTVLCPGQTTQLCAAVDGAIDYWWSTGAQTQCINVTAPGTYSLTITTAGGCMSFCSKTVTLIPASCEITGNSALCVGQSTELCVPTGALSYRWNTGATTNCITVNTTGNYSVTVTYAAGCTSVCSKRVTIGQVDTCLITGPAIICPGQTVRLCVPPLAGTVDYWWITGAQTQCIDVTMAGTYSVTVTDANGCKSECTKVVTMSEGATCQITGADVIRPGGSTQLCVSSGALTYRWSNGATTNCITVNATGTYSVTVTYAEGCTSVCSKTIGLVSEVNCIITGNSFICPGRLAQLCAPALAKAYLWSTGETTRCIYVSSASTYSVAVTYVGGIVRTCSKTIGLNEDTTCEITGDTVLCLGKTTRLCAPAGAIDYWWSTGEQTQCINVTTPGTYGLTLTTEGGCMSFCSKTVTRCPEPINLTEKSIVEKQVFQRDGNIEVRIYPNPLYSKTMIEFQNTESDSRVLIDIYTSTGRKVATVFNGEVEKNVQYNTEWRCCMNKKPISKTIARQTKLSLSV